MIQFLELATAANWVGCSAADAGRVIGCGVSFGNAQCFLTKSKTRGNDPEYDCPHHPLCLAGSDVDIFWPPNQPARVQDVRASCCLGSASILLYPWTVLNMPWQSKDESLGGGDESGIGLAECNASGAGVMRSKWRAAGSRWGSIVTGRGIGEPKITGTNPPTRRKHAS